MKLHLQKRPMSSRQGEEAEECTQWACVSRPMAAFCEAESSCDAQWPRRLNHQPSTSTN
ncbi:unnamed protein product [Prunus brigantina]